MSESKHTPGPWSVDEDTRPGMEWNRHIYGPDGLAICFMAHSDGKATERDEANAALIASAPALAAEVERLREIARDAAEYATRHQAEVLDLRRKVEALEKGAARYAWLRKNPAPLGYMQTARDLGLDLTRIYLDSPEKLDAAIDAALAAEPKP